MTRAVRGIPSAVGELLAGADGRDMWRQSVSEYFAVRAIERVRRPASADC